MIPEAPEHDPKDQDKFQKFVTWCFYAMIVLIGYGILGKFDAVDKKFDDFGAKMDGIRMEMSSMNSKLVQIFERQGFNDKEIEHNRAAIVELRKDVDQLKRRP